MYSALHWTVNHVACVVCQDYCQQIPQKAKTTSVFIQLCINIPTLYVEFSPKSKMKKFDAVRLNL